MHTLSFKGLSVPMQLIITGDTAKVTSLKEMQHTQSLLTFFFLEGLIFRAVEKFYQSGSLGNSREEFRLQNNVVYTCHIRTIFMSEVRPTVL